MRYWDGSEWTGHTAASPAIASEDDSQAAFPYIFGIFFAFLPALILYLTKKDHPRVRFHSAQVLNTEILLFGLHFLGMAVWFVGIFATIFAAGTEAGPATGIPAGFGLLLLIWIGIFSLVFVRVGLYIWLAVSTSRGEDKALRYIPTLVKP